MGNGQNKEPKINNRALDSSPQNSIWGTGETLLQPPKEPRIGNRAQDSRPQNMPIHLPLSFHCRVKMLPQQEVKDALLEKFQTFAYIVDRNLYPT